MWAAKTAPCPEITTTKCEGQEANARDCGRTTVSSGCWKAAKSRTDRQFLYSENKKHLQDKCMCLHTAGALHQSELIGSRKPFQQGYLNKNQTLVLMRLVWEQVSLGAQGPRLSHAGVWQMNYVQAGVECVFLSAIFWGSVTKVKIGDL